MLSRDAIVAAARRQVEASGFETVSLRAVARELEVTAPALYDHVESKADLLALVAGEGFDELYGSFADGGVDDPLVRLRDRSINYVRFAVAHPELFRLMFQFRPAEVAIEVDNELPAATRAFEAAFADIEAAVTTGQLPDRDVVELSLMLWAAVHGVATVAQLIPSGDHERVAAEVTDALLAGLHPERQRRSSSAPTTSQASVR